MKQFRKFGAVVGAALTALVLAASTLHPQSLSSQSDASVFPALSTDFGNARKLYYAGSYSEARASPIQVAKRCEKAKLFSLAAKAWGLAGSCALIDLRFRDALESYQRGKQLADSADDRSQTLIACSNISALYQEIGDPQAALHFSQMGLSYAEVKGQETTFSALRLQLASALAKLNRFKEALPLYLRGSKELEEAGEFTSAYLGLSKLGSDAIEAGRLDLAESALTKALYVSTMHAVKEPAVVLRKLARLRQDQGDLNSASHLYSAAVIAPSNTNPPWLVYADRGEFRLSQHDDSGAFQDFHEARDLVRKLRADVVPSDQGRVNLENGLSRVADGFIEAGNQQLSTIRGKDQRKLRIAETFDVAEQDRSMSLAALTPLPNDWRSRLPAEYWDLLNRYRSLERGDHANPKVDILRLQISQMEAAAGPGIRTEQTSALQHVRSILQPTDVFLSFHLGKRQSWLWVVNRNEVQVIPLPARAELDTRIQEFRTSVREGSPSLETEGRELFRTLFGNLPASGEGAKRWIVELDGPLFDLPLAALVVPATPRSDGLPVFLGEKVALQLAPAAPLMRKGRSLAGGTFVGVADPIYNAADSRYRGRSRKPPLTLPRLPSSQSEVAACAREYAPDRSILLTGSNASLPALLATLKTTPTVLHFATHIIPSPGEYHSGLIALGLDRQGEMDLLGPTEIVARKVEAELVVLNGCQSGQAQTVPGSGLMGLTRAWIGSGANAVLATRWDVPDEDGQALMLAFYQSIRQHPDENVAFALQRARQTLLQKDEARRRPSTWAAYFLFART